ncbi:hypothetical protein HZA44_04290 [Candidatus Peregrinibacteria bacterium]|nr:hypothetical protein [Candidatus Peregrinibacteria bacterium]
MKALNCLKQHFSLFNSRFVFAETPHEEPKTVAKKGNEVTKDWGLDLSKEEKTIQMEGLDLRSPAQRAKDSAKDYTDAVAELEASLAKGEKKKLELDLPKKPTDAPSAIAKKSSPKGPEIAKK